MDYAAVVFLEILYMIAFLALISAGLAVVFGMMRVINLAHGEFVMLGGYATIAAPTAPASTSTFAMLVLAPLVVGVIGLIVERLVIRHLYGRMIDTMLATWGLSLLMVGLVTLIFGNTAVSVPAPIPGYQVGALPDGRLQPLHHRRSRSLLMLVLWLVLRYTRIGLIARGAMQSADVASSLGYNPQKIYMWTFTAGAALSGLAGGVLAPLTGLLPSSGSLYIAKAFITVITGGAAIISGTLASSAIFGTDQPDRLVRLDAGDRRDRDAGAGDHPAAPDAAGHHRPLLQELDMTGGPGVRRRPHPLGLVHRLRARRSLLLPLVSETHTPTLLADLGAVRAVARADVGLRRHPQLRPRAPTSASAPTPTRSRR